MVSKPDGSHGWFRRFYDETYNLRTISTRRLWFNAFLFPCCIVLGILLIADVTGTGKFWSRAVSSSMRLSSSAATT